LPPPLKLIQYRAVKEKRSSDLAGYFVIKKEKNKYILYSKSGGRRLGTFKTKSAAMKRERQIKYFKSK